MWKITLMAELYNDMVRFELDTKEDIPCEEAENLEASLDTLMLPYSEACYTRFIFHVYRRPHQSLQSVLNENMNRIKEIKLAVNTVKCSYPKLEGVFYV